MGLTGSDVMKVKHSAQALAVVMSTDGGEMRLDSDREEPQMPLCGGS